MSATGFGPAMRRSSPSRASEDRLPPTLRTLPGPGDVGLPTEDDGIRDHRLLARTCSGSPAKSPTLTPCARPPRGSSSRRGAESEGTFPYRAAPAVAERLGTEAVVFPSHHRRS